MKNSQPTELYQAGGAYSSVYDQVALNVDWYQELMDKFLKVAQLFYSAEGQWNILDAGGGTGNLSALFQKAFPQADICLAEKHRGMALHALEKGITPEQFLEADLKKLSQKESASQDLIICSNVFYHFDKDELAEVCSEFSRLLKKGGRLLVASPQNWSLEKQKKFETHLEAELQAGRKLHKLSEAALRQGIDSNRCLIQSMKSTFSNQELANFMAPFGLRPVFSSTLYDGLLYFCCFEKISSGHIKIERESALINSHLIAEYYSSPQTLEDHQLPTELQEGMAQFYMGYPRKVRPLLQKVVDQEKQFMLPERMVRFVCKKTPEAHAGGMLAVYRGGMSTSTDDRLPLEYFFPSIATQLREETQVIFELKRGCTWGGEKEKLHFDDLLDAAFYWIKKHLGPGEKKFRVFGHTITHETTEVYRKNDRAKVLAENLNGHEGHALIEYFPR